ncbi:MAG: DUF3098 domain-containing protein [Bacteroidaceae bacterium]|nr:DUF3098 domain-containing protein [Bacteroidaceae bacterium]
MKNNLAFGKINYLILLLGIAIVVIGFVLMSGDGTTEEAFNPDIFSATRIKVAPVVCLVGFLTVIAAVLVKPRNNDNDSDNKSIEE